MACNTHVSNIKSPSFSFFLPCFCSSGEKFGSVWGKVLGISVLENGFVICHGTLCFCRGS